MSWDYWTPEPAHQAKADITIPPEALEAGARAIAESLRTARLTTEAQDGYKPEACAAFRAMIEEWPMWTINTTNVPGGYLPALILPLTENPDDKA